MMIGTGASGSTSWICSISSTPVMSGSPRSSTTQSKRSVPQRVQRLGAGSDGRRLDVAVADQLDDRAALDLVVLDHQQPPRRAVDEADQAVERIAERLPLDRLGQVGDGAELQRPLALVGRPR